MSRNIDNWEGAMVEKGTTRLEPTPGTVYFVVDGVVYASRTAALEAKQGRE